LALNLEHKAPLQKLIFFEINMAAVGMNGDGTESDSEGVKRIFIS
jgi:hypothetical protein